MQRPYRDRIALVTGGGSGIGRALCLDLARGGAHVVMAGLLEDRLDEVAELIESEGGRAEWHHVDVTDAEAFQALIRSTHEQHGRLDYLFNNAGITLLAEARDMTLDQWHRIIDVNVKGVINGIHAAYPIMVEQGFGNIVNTASLAGITGYPTAVPYAASKAAVLQLTHSLREEARELGVNVSAVCPGYVKTRIFDGDRIVNAYRDEILSRLPLPMIPAEQAARSILKGVDKGKPVIIFPATSRITAWSQRYTPALVTPITRGILKTFRRSRARYLADQGEATEA